MGFWLHISQAENASGPATEKLIWKHWTVWLIFDQKALDVSPRHTNPLQLLN